MERRAARHPYRQFFPQPPVAPPERQSGGEFFALLAILAVVGAALLRLWGLPHLPHPVVTVATVRSALATGAPPYAAIVFAGATLLWALWLWTAVSLLLQVALALADTATRGAHWVASLRAVADRLTLPLVRRAARQVVVAATLIQLASRAVPMAVAAPAPNQAPTAVAQTAHPTAAKLTNQSTPSDGTVWHRVEPGDNLWLLAQRYYGDGDEWRQILRANVGRPMIDGQTFPATGVIDQGWMLRIPGSTVQTAAPAPEPQETYVVRPGDTLSGIAQRYLGNALRWPEIYNASRGAHLPDGRTLRDPNLIWPGLVVTIPGATPPAMPAPANHAPAAQVKPAAPPAPSAPIHHPTPRPAASPVEHTPTAAPPRATPHRTTTSPIAPPTGASAPPTPAVASLSPVPSTLVPSPTALPPAPTPAGVATINPIAEQPPATGGVTPLAAGGLAALAAGGVVLLARRRTRTSRAEPPLPSDYRAGIPLNGGFAEAAAAPTFARRLEGGREPAVLVAEQVLACLAAEQDLQDVRLLTVHEGRHALAVTLQAGLAAQGRLLAIAPDLAERLGAHGAAVRTPDHDVFLQLTDLTLLELAARPRTGPAAPVPLVALGVSARGEAVHVNWELLGHTLIAGLPNEGAGVVWTSLLTALAARRHPDQLALWTIAPPALVPAPVRDFPQQRCGIIDPADEAGVRAALTDVRTELERRLGAGTAHVAANACPDIVVAVYELAALPVDDGLLDLLGRYGAACGIHLLAATTRPVEVADALLDVFRTRLILRTADEAQSVRLIGQPDAADLGGAGDLFARLEGREPLRLRGFRIAPDYLAHLIEAMQRAFSGLPPTAATTASAMPGLNASDPETPAHDHAAGHGSPPPQSRDSVATETDVPPPPSVSKSSPNPSPASPGSSVNNAPTVDHRRRNGQFTCGSDVAGATPPSRAPSTGVAPLSVNGTAAPSLLLDAPRSAAPLVPTTSRLVIHCFGTLEVLGDGQPLTPGTAQRPWELLLYLALRPPAGVSREELLVTFWRQVDPDHAIDRLNTALSRLRALLARALPDLPSDIVRLERDGVCHLDTSLVWSDAQEFLAVREAARRLPPVDAVAALEQARSLYRGEVFRQPAYTWVDEPGEDALTLRESFEESHAVLSERLARLYTELGMPAKAAPLYQELLRREPAIQQLAPALYRCYQALGDREGLLRAHQELDAALARHRRRAEASGEDVRPYRLAPATVAAYEQAFAVLDSRSA